MFTPYLQKHLQQIQSTASLYEKVFIVYVGFPNWLLRAIENAGIKTFETTSKVIANDKIDLIFIKEQYRTILQKVLTFERGVNLLTYEEVMILQVPNLKMLTDAHFIIVRNNIDIEYPFQGNLSPTDWESQLDDEFKNTETSIFQEFYSELYLRNKQPYARYYDFEDLRADDKLELVNFFEVSDELPVGTVPYGERDSILISATSELYIDLKTRLFFNNIPKKLQLNLPEDAKLNVQLLQQLNIVLSVLNKNGVDYLIGIEEAISASTYVPREQLKSLLAKYYNFNSFRDLLFYKNPSQGPEKVKISQGEIIDEIVEQAENAISGKAYRDYFLTAPTGAGKSLLYQLPGIYLHTERHAITLIISPLKALMHDQIRSLHDRNIWFASCINSDITPDKREEIVKRIKDGTTSIVYLSPELLLSYQVEYFVGAREIGLVVIDEAHLVSTWGKNFRADYWYLGTYLQRLRSPNNSVKHNFPILAMTATAVYGGQDDLVFETINSLNMNAPIIRMGNVRRENISFDIRNRSTQTNYKTLKKRETLDEIDALLNAREKDIVYFPFVSVLKDVLSSVPVEKQVLVAAYYGDLDKDERVNALVDFKNGKRRIILATKAFGMGIDIPDITTVFHYAPSGDLSDYVQEVGRAARETGSRGIALTNYYAQDLNYTKILYGLSAIRQYQVHLCLKKLHEMYKLKGTTRNFLVSIEDFELIFHDSNSFDIPQKVKSALLLAEKDLVAKYGYNVILVRPKALFSTVFARCHNDVIESLMTKYNPDIEEIFDESFNSSPNHTLVKLYLDKIWEKHFRRESFPQIKWKFFSQRLLFNEDNRVIPQSRMTIRLKSGYQVTSKELAKFFGSLTNIFKKYRAARFSERELHDDLIKMGGFTEQMAGRISDLLESQFSQKSTNANQSSFLQVFQDPGNPNGRNLTFRVHSNSYLSVEASCISLLNKLFGSDRNTIVKYIFQHSDSWGVYKQLAFILETLGLASYEIVGGDHPQIFVRINNPTKLEYIVKGKYENNLVKDIERRHKKSIDVMDQFFTSKMSDVERWDFIEGFFLGSEKEWA